ncbi:HAMP domain-containing protein [Halobaculum litoreum]|uniref:HAMP domain-containing protein n=1 Tax=Halobaculum litoreum TaxID=3031998 RepID=A0ABD5XQA4_9EURY
MDLVSLLPKPLRRRMITEVLAAYAVTAAVTGGIVVGIGTATGLPVTALLAAWGVTAALFVAGGYLIARDLIDVSNGLTASARELADGDFSATFDQQRDDELGELNAALSRLRASLRDRLDEAEAARGEAAAARDRAEGVVREMRAAVDEYETAFAAAADGDLTVRLDADTDEAALGDLEAAANGMLAGLEDTVGAVEADARAVDDDSRALAAEVTDATAAIDEATDAVDDIAGAAAAQRERLDDVAGDLGDLSATVEEVAGQADGVAREVEDAAELGAAGREAASDAADEMAGISDQVATANEAVMALEDRMDEITEMVELIEGSPPRRTCSRSTPTSRPPARARRATASPSSPRR